MTIKLKKLKTPVIFNICRPYDYQGLDIPVQSSKGLEFFGSKFYLHGKAPEWTLSEYSTGASVAKGHTQKRMLERFAANMPATAKEFQALLKRHIELYGQLNE